MSLPELPEVESARLEAEERLREKRIFGVYAARDGIVFEGVGGRKIRSALEGGRIAGFGRKGKYVWMEVAGRGFVVFHFGMTGRFEFYEKQSERSRFCKLEITVDNGCLFGVVNVRRLGRIRLADNPLELPAVRRLGYDVLCDRLEVSEICRILGRRKAAVKAVLLDQKVFAGVGNWIADEVLYQAGVDPRRRACELGEGEVKAICRCMKRIVSRAVEVRADKERFGRGWLFHYRWGKKNGAVDARGEKICFCTLGGRTTAWVPARQR